MILDEQGNRIWPAESTAVTEDVLDNGVVEQVYMGDMILTHENSAEQTTIVQEENAAYEEGVIGQADVVTEDVVQQADGIAEVGDNDEHSCPYFYLWDMQGLGKLSALTTIALINDEITGAADETFTAGDLGDYTITTADDGGTEVVLGAPLEFNPDNIEEMAKLY